MNIFIISIELNNNNNILHNNNNNMTQDIFINGIQFK